MKIQYRGHDLQIDECDLWLLDRYAYQVAGTRGKLRLKRQEKRDGKRFNIYLYHDIMQPAAGCIVDHRDGDTMNNCRANLRVATYAQNAFNRRPQVKNALGIKGVHFRKGRFIARIKTANSRHILGYFKTAQEAARAYDDAALAAFGEFAWLNSVHGHLLTDEKAHDHA